MKYGWLLFSFFTSLSVAAECLYLEKEPDIRGVSDLRRQANLVLDAEGTHCDPLTDRTLRSACQCKYRKQPLIQFRESYQALLIKHPEYTDRMVCYSDEHQGISVNFIAYKVMQSWCVSS